MLQRFMPSIPLFQRLVLEISWRTHPIEISAEVASKEQRSGKHFGTRNQSVTLIGDVERISAEVSCVSQPDNEAVL